MTSRARKDFCNKRPISRLSMTCFPGVDAMLFNVKRKACDKPCSECPLRRKSGKGWLGAANPRDFMDSLMSDYPMPCHKTIDYEDPLWKEKWEEGAAGKLCAGALIFFANIGKVSRDRFRQRMAGNSAEVFTRPDEFVEHHESAP